MRLSGRSSHPSPRPCYHTRCRRFRRATASLTPAKGANLVARAFHKLPSARFLHECLIYKSRTGVFIWRKRPLSHFLSERIQGRWNDQWAGKPAGSLSIGYKVIKIGGKKYKASRVAWKMMTGRDPQNLIDHRNLDRANNRWENLYDTTYSQNGMNRKINSNNSSGHKGVSRVRNGWRAVISLGYFRTPEEASRAYRRAVQLLQH